MSTRWTEVTASAYPWEQEALRYIRERLPDQEPFRAWANFEFVAEDGSINEVDLLVLSLYKLFLVEIKSRPGRVSGDAGTWTWTHEGRLYSEDNPLLLANRKAKKLKSLLGRQPALHKSRVPYIAPLIFLSAPGQRCDLSGPARHGVYLRQETERRGAPDILAVLTGATEPAPSRGAAFTPRPDRRVVQAVGRAMDQAGIRPSQRARQVSDYRLERLLHECAVYQDWEATHVSLPDSKHRVRMYPHGLQATEMTRQQRRQAAEREYRLLESITHPGILKVEGFTEHVNGPAVIFEHDPQAERLDLFLRERAEQLDRGMRLALVRQIAETLQHAHERRLYHRALSPQTIFVTAPDSPKRHIKIFDWQTAQRDSTTGNTPRPTSEDSLNLGLFGDHQSLLYMAPEAIAGMAYDAPKLDLFALGAVAYHVFSGLAPAASIEELQQKCAAGRGLRISEVMDGAGAMLQELIQFSTTPDVSARFDTIRDFLEWLDHVENELTQPEPEPVVNPIDARVQDKLEGGFVVKKRLGKGSTCIALLVERAGQEGVLKVALEPRLNDRLVAEGRILQTLRHQHIVELYEQVDVSGHAALFMELAGVEIKAGAYTLAQRIRHEGRLSLDLVQRFGEELLAVTDWLEQHGVAHRDIKPDNIGVGQTPTGALKLMLFDFSLSNTSYDHIRAGTPPYLDPFLRRRTPPRWEPSADRFAVAMTLYEMLTGTLPIWGDGQSDPAALDEEVSLDSDLFDPAVRDALVAFFAKALHSDYRQRFDNAEEMRRAWRRVFDALDRPATETDHSMPVDEAEILAQATEETPLTVLGVAPRLLDALSRLGVHTVGELLKLPRIRLYRNQGLGQQTIKDIRELWERVTAHFAARGTSIPPAPAEDHDHAVAPAEPQVLSVDRMARLAVSNRLAATEERCVHALLGLDPAGETTAWSARQEVAAQLGEARHTVERVLQRARSRWLKQRWMTVLREDIAALLDKYGQVMTTDELANAVLTARGSAAAPAERLRVAAAVAAAAVETEAAREGARYTLYRGQQQIFVAATPELSPSDTASATARARYAERLGTQADTLATADPLVAPQRALAALLAIAPPDGALPCSPDRILRLAVAASHGAALSSRLELYPRGMEAARALKLGLGSLLGPKSLTVTQIQQRIASRYPAAAPLPGHPALGALLQDAGLELVWDGTGAAGQGVYHPRNAASGVSSPSSTVARAGTDAVVSSADETVQRLEDRLARTVRERRFLILTVAPRYLLRAEAKILRRFAVSRLSLETLLLQAMQQAAEAAGAHWEVVLQADAAPRDSRDWRNLQLLVRRAMPIVEQTLRSAEQPVLLVYPGLLARYSQVAVLETLRDACARGQDVPGFVVLMAADEQRNMPVLDGTPIPVLQTSEWARIPRAWLEHAAGAGERGV